MKLPLISWEDVTNNTAQSCFTKARILSYNELWALVDLDDFFIELRNSIEQLKELNSKEISNGIFPEEFDSLDDSVVTTHLVWSDKLNIDIAKVILKKLKLVVTMKMQTQM